MKPTPIFKAVKDGDILAVGRLLDSGADPNDMSGGRPLLVDVAWSGNVPLLHLLLNARANVDAGLEGGWSAFAAAAVVNHVEAVRVLLAAGASVKVRPDGFQLLNFLEWGGYKTKRHPDIVKRLREAGAKAQPYKWLVWTWHARYFWTRLLRRVGIRRSFGPPPWPPPIPLPSAREQH